MVKDLTMIAIQPLHQGELKYWGLNSEVIYPPVNIKRFKFNLERENFYLSVCRLGQIKELT